MEKEENLPEKVVSILKRLDIDLDVLKSEQRKLAKQVKLKDSVDFSEVKMIAGVDTATIGRDVVAGIVVLDSNMEIVEEKFAVRKAEFPYISEFRSYRELPAIMECYQKLETDVDLFIVEGNGILHPRRLGIASHFGILVQKPTIGVAKSMMFGDVKGDKIYSDDEVLGSVLVVKKGSNPIYVSPGHLISLKTATEIVKKLIRPPHKLPEPLDAAHRYVNNISDELK
jgi:deoxyribonuclease V